MLKATSDQYSRLDSQLLNFGSNTSEFVVGGEKISMHGCRVFPYLGRERWLEAKINDSNLHKFEEKIISVSDHGKGGTLKLNQEVRGGE